MEDVRYHQSNLVNAIFSHIYVLLFPYMSQGHQEPVYTHTTTSIPHADPMISPIFQPLPEDNASTDTASTIIHQLLNILQKIQQQMVHIQSNQEGVGVQTNNLNTLHLSTR